MLTQKQVLEALQKNMAYEFDNGQHRYNLHIKDNGVIVDSCSKADMSFHTYTDDELEENEKNLMFIEVVEDLTNQANDYLKDWLEL